MATAGPEGGELLGEDPPWSPWTPEEVAERLRGLATRWYVVAGWAIELFVGRPLRSHADLEVGVPAAGFAELRRALAAYSCRVVGSSDDGVGRAWPLESAAFDAHFQTWFSDPTTGATRLDVFRDPHDGDTWICRRDPTIRRPYEDLVATTPSGIPYLAPEAVLLFKAKHAQDKDALDLAAALPRMRDAQVRWLADALERVHPGHAWLPALADRR